MAIRIGLPTQNRYAYYLAWAGLACMVVYTISQWREIARMFSRRQTRQGTLAATSVLIVLGILVAINYICEAADQALGPDGRQAVHACRTRVATSSPSWMRRCEILVFDRETEFQRFRDRLRGVRDAARNRSRPSTSIRTGSPRSPSSTRSSSTARLS